MTTSDTKEAKARESLTALLLTAMEWGRDYWASFSARGDSQREVAEQFADKWLAALQQAKGEQTAPTDTSHLNCLEAQAIDRAYAICEPCNTGFPERCLYKRPKGEQPAPAADEREAFIAAFRERMPLWQFQDDGTGGFHNQCTDWAWIGWQARAALSAPAPAGDAPALEQEPYAYELQWAERGTDAVKAELRATLPHDTSGYERIVPLFRRAASPAVPGDTPKGEGQ